MLAAAADVEVDQLAGQDGRAATVFCQLIVGGTRHGVHAIIVPLRDAAGAVLPGVSIRDCGAKVGLNGVDNGAIQFDTVNERYTLKRYDPAEVSLGATVVSGSDLYKTGSFTPAYNADGTFAPPTWAESTTSLIPATTLMFRSNGQVPNIPLGDMAVVELRTPNGEIRKRVFVESTGRMHVWRWNGGAWTQE